MTRFIKRRNIKAVVPVLPSSDIARDLVWYQDKLGFEPIFSDTMYAVLKLGNIHIHLQWHADTPEDPLLGGSVIRVFVKDIVFLFQNYLATGTVQNDQLRLNTPWDTHEFGLYDLNKNALFFVQDI